MSLSVNVVQQNSEGKHEQKIWVLRAMGLLVLETRSHGHNVPMAVASCVLTVFQTLLPVTKII